MKHPFRDLGLIDSGAGCFLGGQWLCGGVVYRTFSGATRLDPTDLDNHPGLGQCHHRDVALQRHHPRSHRRADFF